MASSCFIALFLRCWRILPLGSLLVIKWRSSACFIALLPLLLRILGSLLVINGGFCLFYSIALLRCWRILPLGSLLVINGGLPLYSVCCTVGGFVCSGLLVLYFPFVVGGFLFHVHCINGGLYAFL
jgi:hypothetical protein